MDTQKINLLQNNDLWLIEPREYMRLSAMYVPALGQAKQGQGDGKDKEKPYTVERGLVTLPIHGIIERKLSKMDKCLFKWLGIDCTESGELAQVIAQVQDDPNVTAVLFDIDSPGGTVNGTPELAAAVSRLCKEKHVYAFTAGLCCSAAYWVASKCDVIYAAPSAVVGSIGVVMSIVDSSELHKNLGLKVEVFAAGKYKAAGLTGTSLTDEQRELLQSQVDATCAEFKAEVTRRRTIDDADMQGQCFRGVDAIRRGLVNARIDSLAFLQAKLMERHGQTQF